MISARAIGRIGIAALLLTGVGCGKAAEKVAEKATEKAIENEAGGDADVDLSNGKVKVSDGKGGSSEVDVSGDADLPDDFPADLEVPGTTKVLLSSSSSADGRNLQQVTVYFDGSVADVYEAYKQQLTDAGYEIESDTSGDQGGSSFGSATASNDRSTVSAIFSEDPSAQGTASITVAAK